MAIESAEEFLRALPWERTWKWFDRVGVHELDKNRVAKVTLSIDAGRGMATVGSYNGVVVEIVHKQNGRIEWKPFYFGDYLKERKDDRRTPGGQHYYDNNGWFGIIDHCGWHWYIAVPATPEKFTEAVEDYILMFR